MNRQHTRAAGRRTRTTRAAAFAAAVAGALALAGGAGAAGLPATQFMWLYTSPTAPLVETALAQTAAPGASAAGDLDGDGLDDLVMLDGEAAEVVVAPGSTGEPAAGVALGVVAPAVVAAVRVADVTGDGLPDVVAALDTPAVLVTLPGDGTGALGTAIVSPLTGMPWFDSRATDLAIADVDGDDVPDALVSLRLETSSVPDNIAGQLLLHHGDGSGSFAQPQNLPVCYDPQRALAADVDGDGTVDVVAICRLEAAVGLNAGTAPDTEPPSIGPIPEGLVLQAESSAGAVLPAGPHGVDNRDGYLVATCTPAVLRPGTWDVTCTAADRSGNRASETFPVTVAVALLDIVPPAESTQQRATLSWSTRFATRTSCSLDGAAYSPCSAPRTYNSLAAGPHTFCVRALEDVAPSCTSWTIVGPGAPVARITGILPVPGKPRSVTVTFAADQPATRFTCSLDGGAFKSCSSGLTFNGLALGTHEIRVLATNFAGQVSAAPAPAAFTIG